MEMLMNATEDPIASLVLALSVTIIAIYRAIKSRGRVKAIWVAIASVAGVYAAYVGIVLLLYVAFHLTLTLVAGS